MGYWINKTVWFLTSPLDVSIALIAVGIWLTWHRSCSDFWAHLGRWMARVGAIILLLISLPITAHVLGYGLERNYEEHDPKDVPECGLPEEKIAVKGNFVPAGRVGGRVDKKEQILYVGRLSDEKGIGTLLRAWRMLAGQASETFPQKLVLVGDGERRDECERLSEGLPVEFAGQKPHEEVVRLMAESRAVILPSECWETFGLTVVEGMRAGTPPVVSNLGALPDIVSSDCGEVFEAGNAESLAAAIIRILSRPDYAEVCKTVRREAEAKYSEEANYGRLMEIYEAVRK